MAGAGQRLTWLHTNRIGGQTYTYTVRAVREARDPIDASGVAVRDIASADSAVRQARALSEIALQPPGNVETIVDGTTVIIEWTNGSYYNSLEIFRKRVADYQFTRLVAINGQRRTYRDESVPSGSWIYEVRGIGPISLASATSSATVV
jgi:hypothetical protein